MTEHQNDDFGKEIIEAPVARRRNPGGRGNFRNLDDKQIRQVEYCSGLGLSEKDIIAIIGVTKGEFERLKLNDKNLMKALDVGTAKAKSAVAQTMYKLAISGKYPSATMFWLKTQAGWSESLPVKKQPDDQPEVIFQTKIGSKGELISEHSQSGKK